MAKKGLLRLYIIAAILIAVFLPGFAKYQRLRSQNSNLKATIAKLETENRRLLAERRRLETDPVYVEKKAREKLGVVKKGEIVYKVPSE